MNIAQPHFQNADKAREYLEAQVWPDSPICPHCGVIGDHYKLEGKSTRPGLYKCKDCREPFTVTVGTVFERSKVPLNKWLLATYLLCSSKKGMSSHQLHRTLGVTYKTAWFMCHRIREAMKSEGGLLGSSGQPVEADITYWGNQKNQTYKYGKRTVAQMMKVVSLVERGGEKRSFRIANAKAKDVRAVIHAHVSKKAHLMTDQGKQFTKVGREFDHYSTVNHAKFEYARGEVTTNNVEASFSLLKRGLVGTFHQVGEQHLQRYATEFDFRWNHRNTTDKDRTDAALRGIQGKRLTYGGPNGPKETSLT